MKGISVFASLLEVHALQHTYGDRHGFIGFEVMIVAKPLRPCVLLPRLLPCSCSSLVILTLARASTADQSIGAHLMTSATGLSRDVVPESGLAVPISTLSDCMVLPGAPQTTC